VLEDKPVDPGSDGGIDAGMCDPPCTDATPVCNANTECVECTADDRGYCAKNMLVCKIETSECVECVASSDCNDPGASRCDTSLNQCDACESNEDCMGIEGLSVCDAGTCVQCTPATEPEKCSGTSCDPATLTCTETILASRETCQRCVSDSECKEAGNRCVAMTYQDKPYPDARTGFCLKTFTMGDPCQQPYFVPLLGRESLSGPPVANFCGIDEANVTCLAVLALLNNVECLSGDDSECPESGLCRDFIDGLAENRCTYRCDDPLQCKKPPVAGSTCGDSGFCGG